MVDDIVQKIKNLNCILWKPFLCFVDCTIQKGVFLVDATVIHLNLTGVMLIRIRRFRFLVLFCSGDTRGVLILFRITQLLWTSTSGVTNPNCSLGRYFENLPKILIFWATLLQKTDNTSNILRLIFNSS